MGWFVVEGSGGGGGFEFDLVAGLRSRLLCSGGWFGKGGGIKKGGSNSNVRGKIGLVGERVGYGVGGWEFFVVVDVWVHGDKGLGLVELVFVLSFEFLLLGEH